jgi:hypothetical protein
MEVNIMKITMKCNPSVHQEPRYQPIPITPLSSKESLLQWLRQSGRLKPRQADAHPDSQILGEIDALLDQDDYAIEEEE